MPEWSGPDPSGDRPTSERRGQVAIVGGGPGDPELITRRGWRLLGEADVVVTDHLAPVDLLDELSHRPTVIDAAKYPGGRSMPQDVINRHLVDNALAGRRVVRLKGGDPFVFGRGMEELQACLDAGVQVQVVPGVTSAIAAPALAGIPVTHRGMTHAFTVVSAHVPPGHPDSRVDWTALAASGATLVILMGVKTLPSIVAALIDGGMSTQTPAAVIVSAFGPQTRLVRAPLGRLTQYVSSVTPPAVTIIGPVADLPGEFSQVATWIGGVLPTVEPVPAELPSAE